jgi:hypothetical protein
MILANFLNRLIILLFLKISVMTVATPLLTKKLWWFVLVWLWHKHLSLSYWGIFLQYEDHSHLAAAGAM